MLQGAISTVRAATIVLPSRRAAGLRDKLTATSISGRFRRHMLRSAWVVGDVTRGNVRPVSTAPVVGKFPLRQLPARQPLQCTSRTAHGTRGHQQMPKRPRSFILMGTQAPATLWNNRGRKAALSALALLSAGVSAFVPAVGPLRAPAWRSATHAGLSMSAGAGSSPGGWANMTGLGDLPPLVGYSSANEPQLPLGKVSLVGAGPGDPDLLTIAALRELESADLVVADRLISPEILSLIKGELRVARKYPGCAEQAQQEIYGWVKEGILKGRHVVRLKIGDPFVFGRGGEEVLQVREFGVECKVIPGISSVFSAPLLGGIPVTHRGVAHQVTLGTGYGKDYSKPDICDYHPQKTAVFLMAIGRLEELCKDLHAHGYPGDCPVGIVENASTPRQRVVAGTVDNIVEVARDLEVKPPSTIVVGEVVRVLHGDVTGLVTGHAAPQKSDAAAAAAAAVAGVEVAAQQRQVQAQAWAPPPRVLTAAASGQGGGGGGGGGIAVGAARL